MTAERASAGIQSPATTPRKAIRVPRQKRSRRSRAQILAAAEACFEAFGYEGTTTTGIAKAAGISIGTLYSYFHNKGEILLEIVDDSMAGIAAVVDRELDPRHLERFSPGEIVESLVALLFRSKALRPGIQQILMERYVRDPELRVPLESLRDQMRSAIDRFANALARRGLLRDVDREWVSFVVLHAVQWNATQAYLHATAEEADAIAESTATMISRYLIQD